MIIKKFLAKTETEAIEMAKRELGSNAIVMNIKKVHPRGFARFFIKTKVEVTAALDENIVYDTENKSSGTDEKRDGVALELSAPKFVPDIVAVEDEDKNVATIEEKLDSLRKMLEKQMLDKLQEEKTNTVEEVMDSEPDPKEIQAEKESKEVSKAKACKELIFKQMIQNEVEMSIAEMLIDEVDRSLPEDAALDQILAAIYQKIILMVGQPYVLDKEVEMEEGETKYVFFLGSTGVGKTTTIAKIASRMKLDQKKNIALVTADTFRIAAVEQLKTYANILGVPIKVVYSPEDLGEMQEELDQYDICFIDTAGCSHKNREQMENIKKLMEQIPISRREVYLVLNAGAKYSDLKNIADVYSDFTDYSLIFTKLDETTSAGVMLNMRTYTNRPLSYVTWGQNVPDDIGKVDAQKIAKKLLGGKS